MTQVATAQEISHAIQTVYGANGMNWYEYCAGERPELPEAQQIAEFQEDPCPQDTSFFRHGGLLEDFVEYTMPELLAKDGQVTVHQIGASGEEAWSLAIMMEQKGVRSYTIAGYNVNQGALDRAYGPFGTSIEELRAGNAARIGTPVLEQCLEDTTAGLRPLPTITDHAAFNRHDILYGPVPGDVANTLLINNVLWHYPEKVRDHIMANALAGLRPGGAVMLEGCTRDSRQTPDYPTWVRGLREYGLLPWPERSVNSVLRYEPEAADKVFEPSAEITKALDTLTKAREEF